MPWLLVQNDGVLLLRLHVQPRAAKTEIAGMLGDALKVRLAAPPVDGKANRALLDFLADRLRVSKNAVTLKSGESSRQKTVLVRGVKEELARTALFPTA